MFARDTLRTRLRENPVGPATYDLPNGAEKAVRPAAVLVPIILGPAPGVLLTRRAGHLSSHAGQVSFPGGRIDAEDASPEAAALREAAEEIALDPALVEVVGRLADHHTVSGYRVTPVVGLLPDGRALESLGLTPSPFEVDSVLELPMAVLLDPGAPERRRASRGGEAVTFWVWPHPSHFIWGATAAILVDLARRLRGERV